MINQIHIRRLSMLILLVLISICLPVTASHARSTIVVHAQTQSTMPLAVSLTITGRWVDSNGNDHPM